MKMMRDGFRLVDGTLSFVNRLPCVQWIAAAGILGDRVKKRVIVMRRLIAAADRNRGCGSTPRRLQQSYSSTMPRNNHHSRHAIKHRPGRLPEAKLKSQAHHKLRHSGCRCICDARGRCDLNRR
jgi:hypothetical protein